MNPQENNPMAGANPAGVGASPAGGAGFVMPGTGMMGAAGTADAAAMPGGVPSMAGTPDVATANPAVNAAAGAMAMPAATGLDAAGGAAVPGAETMAVPAVGPMEAVGAPGTTGMSAEAMITEALTEGASGAELSMADTLASAEDSLTAAGQAAGTTGPRAMDLSEIAGGDLAASMARPMEPLVPAAPVPGSLGSAVPGGKVAESGAVNAADSVPGAAGAASAAPEMAANAEAVVPNRGMKSSDKVPEGLKPRKMRASDGDEERGMRVLDWILIAVAAVAVAAAVVFAILWIQAANKPAQVIDKQYSELTEGAAGVSEEGAKDNTDAVAAEDVGERTVVCTVAVNPAQTGIEGVVAAEGALNVGLKDGVIMSYSGVTNFGFADVAQAEAAVPMFELMVQVMEEVPGTTSYTLEGANVILNTVVNVAGLEEYSSVPDLLDEDGELVEGVAQVRKVLAAQGYTCE